MHAGSGTSLEDVVYGLRSSYMRLPGPLREISGGMYRRLPEVVRFGPAYTQQARFIAASESWPEDDLREYQWTRLKATLQYAARRVPWYMRTWAEWGVSPADIQAPQDLARLPLTSKADLRAHLDEFVSLDARPRDRLATMTSGSLGSPTRLYYTRGLTRSVERAFIRDMWRRAGYRDGAPIASVRASYVPGHQRGRMWDREPTWNRWLYSSVDMSAENCGRIVGHMEKVQPQFIHAMVSPLTSLAAFVVSSGRRPRLPRLRGVFVGMETSRPWQVELWRRAFGASLSVIRWYGMGEHVALAGSCAESLDYHVFPQYSFVELLPGPDGAAAVARAGERGLMTDAADRDRAECGVRRASPGLRRVVGTSFDNWVMPLIRYDTEDHARPKPGRCACGRPYGLLEDVAGRSNAWAVTSAGEWVPFAQIEAGAVNDAMRRVLRFQFVQECPGALHLFLVPAPGASREDLLRVVEKFTARLGSRFTLTWEQVPEIPPLPSGKHSYFVQTLPLPPWLVEAPRSAREG